MFPAIVCKRYCKIRRTGKTGKRQHLPKNFDAKDIRYDFFRFFVQIRMYESNIIVACYAITESCIT
jgi:hypothetical protein|tara:strand:- start:1849 stop:2046 length:198 start_codon:yes stop_codon:yes gene_type:complete